MENTESTEKDRDNNDGKNIAIIAYLTIIGLVIAYVLNNEKRHKFASFHIRQSLGIVLSILILSALSYIPFIGLAIATIGILVMVVLWFLGITSAANGTTKPVPFVGEYYQSTFSDV
ncbi:MAG: DUF4870 domain-containing protein [Sphingobacterium sp.]